MLVGDSVVKLVWRGSVSVCLCMGQDIGQHRKDIWDNRYEG